MSTATRPIPIENDQKAETERPVWARSEVASLFALPFNDLLYRAHQVHRQHFDPNTVQVSTLLSIKTGKCPEDCAYCPQSVRYETNVEPERLLDLAEVETAARNAKARGASRFCMGAAWRSPKDRDLDQIIDMVRVVKDLDMEACLTLGMLTATQAARLKEAGLDYYNHNLDTSEEFYGEIITTRNFEDRLQTLEHVRAANINVCSGGILGLGESQADRVSFLHTLANLPKPPESVPINMLVQVEGTPLADMPKLDSLEFIRTVAVARILMPGSVIRLSAGRTEMSDEMQAICHFAGANSIFYGEKLLTTPNPDEDADRRLFDRLGLRAAPVEPTVQ